MPSVQLSTLNSLLITQASEHFAIGLPGCLAAWNRIAFFVVVFVFYGLI